MGGLGDQRVASRGRLLVLLRGRHGGGAGMSAAPTTTVCAPYMPSACRLIGAATTRIRMPVARAATRAPSPAAARVAACHPAHHRGHVRLAVVAVAVAAMLLGASGPSRALACATVAPMPLASVHGARVPHGSTDRSQWDDGA